MPQMHAFWILPKGLHEDADRVLDERIQIWGTVPFQEERVQEANELYYFLKGYCESKEYLAVHVNNRMVLEGFQTLLAVKTLRDGYLPCWGLPQNSIGVIPYDQLPDLIVILATMPPYAAWRRLRELCIEAMGQGCHILYRGRTSD